MIVMHSAQNRDIVVAALKHAAPYIRMYKKKIFVLKAGGEIFADVEATRMLMEQVAILLAVNWFQLHLHVLDP